MLPLPGLSAVHSVLAGPRVQSEVVVGFIQRIRVSLLQLSPFKDTLSIASSRSCPRLCTLWVRKMASFYWDFSTCTLLRQDYRLHLGENCRNGKKHPLWCHFQFWLPPQNLLLLFSLKCLRIVVFCNFGSEFVVVIYEKIDPLGAYFVLPKWNCPYPSYIPYTTYCSALYLVGTQPI